MKFLARFLVHSGAFEIAGNIAVNTNACVTSRRENINYRAVKRLESAGRLMNKRRNTSFFFLFIFFLNTFERFVESTFSVRNTE